MSVASTTSARSSTSASARASSARASARSARASRHCSREVLNRPGPRFWRRFAAVRRSAKASSTSPRAIRAASCPSARASSVCSSTAGRTRAGWPSADAAEARRDEPLDEVVDGEVRGRGGEHLLAARDRAPDDLDEHRRLAGAGRPVHERDVLGAVGEVERRRLLLVQRVRQRRPSRGAQEARRLAREHRVPALSGLLVAQPRDAPREPLPGHRRRLELEDDPAVGRPLRRRLVEGDRDRASRPPRDDPAGASGRASLPERHRHEAADADPAGAERPAPAART